MTTITPIGLGLPIKIANQIVIKVESFDVDDLTTAVFYEIYTNNWEMLINGRLPLTVEQYNAWGSDNNYLTDLVLDYLVLTRLIV